VAGVAGGFVQSPDTVAEAASKMTARCHACPFVFTTVADRRSAARSHQQHSPRTVRYHDAIQLALVGIVTTEALRPTDS